MAVTQWVTAFIHLNGFIPHLCRCLQPYVLFFFARWRCSYLVDFHFHCNIHTIVKRVKTPCAIKGELFLFYDTTLYYTNCFTPNCINGILGKRIIRIRLTKSSEEHDFWIWPKKRVALLTPQVFRNSYNWVRKIKTTTEKGIRTILFMYRKSKNTIQKSGLYNFNRCT
jgi:hypothetical protein